MQRFTKFNLSMFFSLSASDKWNTTVCMKSKQEFLAEIEELKKKLPKETYEQKLKWYHESVEWYRKAIQGTTYKQFMEMSLSAPLPPKKQEKK